MGGNNGSIQNITEMYDPATSSWKTLSPMSFSREGESSAVINGKIYVIGGMGLTSVEIYDPSTDTWSSGTALPSIIDRGSAININNKIYLFGGRNASGQNINQVLS